MGLGVLLAGELDSRGQDPLWSEPVRIGVHPPGTVQQEPGSGEKDERQCDLGGNQHRAGARRGASRGAADFPPPFSESCGLVLHNASAGANPASTTVKTQAPSTTASTRPSMLALGQPGNCQRIHADDQGDTKPGEEQSGRAAEHREHQRFDEQLHQHAPASGADRDSDGNLPVPCRPVSEQKVGRVCAGDQQHEEHRAQQDQKGTAGGPDQLIVQRDHPQRVADRRSDRDGPAPLRARMLSISARAASIAMPLLSRAATLSS